MNNFSLKRIQMMLKADWMEHKKGLIVFGALFFSIYMLFLWKGNLGVQISFFFLGIFATLITYYIFIGRKIHRSQERFLMLPSSTMEKYIELLIIGLVLFIAYFLIYILVVWICFLIFKTQLPFQFIFDPNNQTSSMGIGMPLFICIFLFLSCISIRKFALPIGIFFLNLYATLFFAPWAWYMMSYAINGGMNSLNNGYIRSNPFYETMSFIGTYNNFIMCIASAILLYISYLKLKEKQIK